MVSIANSPAEGDEDRELTDAGGNVKTTNEGAAYFDSSLFL
jgi:acyl CoA:acetate/3-ketoacid CoA transferase beta subunit